MRSKSVYVSKLDPRLKKRKHRVKSKMKLVRTRVINGLEYEFQSHPDYPHFCESCDLP